MLKLRLSFTEMGRIGTRAGVNAGNELGSENVKFAMWSGHGTALTGSWIEGCEVHGRVRTETSVNDRPRSSVPRT